MTIAEYAAKVATEPDNAKWVAEVREQMLVASREQLIGKDELVELKRESWRSTQTARRWHPRGD